MLITAKHGLEDPSADVTALINPGSRSPNGLIEKLAVTARNRTTTNSQIKTDPRYEVTQDMKGQLNFLKKVVEAAQKKRADSEREMLLRIVQNPVTKVKTQNELRNELQCWLSALGRSGPGLTQLVEMIPQALQPRRSRVDEPVCRQLALLPRVNRVNMRDTIFDLAGPECDARYALRNGTG